MNRDEKGRFCPKVAMSGFKGFNAGNYGAANAGAYGAANAGAYGAARAGLGGSCRAGRGGVIAIMHEFAPRQYKLRAAEVDGTNIKADTWYKLDADGNFVEAENE